MVPSSQYLAGSSAPDGRSNLTGSPAASLKVPRTNCRYSQHLHLHLRPREMKSASISKNSLFTVGSALEFNGASNRWTQHLGFSRGGTLEITWRMTLPGPFEGGKP